MPDHHFKKVKVKRGVAGLGLFAGENIKKGEMIIEYIGNILNKEEAEAVSSNIQYLFEVNRNKTIDGSPRWNIARYANHACGNLGNAESDTKKGRVFISATKGIKEGDEILYEVLPDQTVVVRKASSLDLDYLSALNKTLNEWDSIDDEQAYRYL